MKKIKIFIIGFIMATTSGCTFRTPVYLDPDFKPVKGQQLLILHGVDARKDKMSVKLEDGYFDKRLNRIGNHVFLKSRGYKPLSDKRSSDIMPPPEIIADMNDTEITALAPKEAELAYLFILEDFVVNYSVIAKTAKAEGRSYLIDTRNGKIVWKERESFTYGHGGLIFGLVPMRDAAFDCCVNMMLESIPKCK